MAIDTKSLTIDSKQLMKLSVSDRVSMAKTDTGQQLLSPLTPTQYASLFPSFYRKQIETEKALSGGGSLTGTPQRQGSLTGVPPTSQDTSRTRQQRTASATPTKTQPAPPAWYRNLEERFGDPKPTTTPGGVNREKFRKELAENETLAARLASLAAAETGSQGREAQQAWMETVFNRAHARGVSLETVIDPNSRYWPRGQKRPNLSKEQLAQYQDIMNTVLAGSNTTDYATDNASSSVAANRQDRKGKWVNGEWFYTDHHYAKAMGTLRQETEEAARIAAEQASVTPEQTQPDGITPKPPVAVPPLPEGMNSAFMDHYNSLPTDAHREKFRKAIHRSIETGGFSVDSINREAEAHRAQQQQQATQQHAIVPPPNDKTKSLQELYPQGSDRFFRQGGKVDGLNPKLVSVLREASKDLPPGYHIRMFSGRDGRGTGTKNHPGGVAVDLAIVDSNGKRLADKGFGEGHQVYEQLAQSMNIRGQEMYPGTKYIWGGAWNVVGAPGDRMHYQIVDPDQPVPGASTTSGQYTFEKGVSPNLWAGQQAVQQFMQPRELSEYQKSIRIRLAQERELAKGNSVATNNTPVPVAPSQIATVTTPGVPGVPAKPVPFFQGHPNQKPTPVPTPTAQQAAAPAPAPTSTATPVPTPAVQQPPAAPPTPATPTPAPSIGETETGKPIPKMKAGGEVQAQREDLAVVNTATGEPQLMFNSTENFEVDKGRLKITPEHRTNPEQLVEQKQKPEPKQETTTQTPIPQRTGPEPVQVGRPSWNETQSTANIFQTESFRRATAQSRFLETGNQVLGGHFSNGNSTVKA